MIKGTFIFGREGIEETAIIRHQVFVEEQGVDPRIETDLYDYFANHLIVKEDNWPVATGRLILKEDQILISRIAVLKKERGRKLGDLVVRMLVNKGFEFGGKKILVHAQYHSKDFYSKIGFKAYGQPYMEAGIKHISMVLTEKDFIDKGCEGCKKV